MSGVPIPAGIDTPSMRAVNQIFEERFAALPIERVLVWHLDSVVESALPDLADMLGVSGPEFGSGPPRSYLRNGVELRRKRGTAGTLEIVLDAIGYEDISIEEGTGGNFLFDDTYSYDGTINFGQDGHWAKFIVRLTVDEIPALDELRLLWDVLIKWKPTTRYPILILALPDYDVWYRARSEIAPPPVITSITPSTGPSSGGTAVTIAGSNFTGVYRVLFDDIDTPFAIVDGAISVTSPSHAGGDVVVELIRSNGRAFSAFSYEAGSIGTVVAIAPALGESDGGTSVVIEVDDSTDATGATVGGIALSAFSIVDATHVGGITGSAGGAVADCDVVVNYASGDSEPLVGAYEYWDPAVDSPALLLLPGDYSIATVHDDELDEDVEVGTWLDSSGNGWHAVSYATPPADDGNGCPVFAADSVLVVPASIADETYAPANLATHDSGSLVAVDVPTAPLEENSTDYENDTIVCGDGATPSIHITDAGSRLSAYDDEYYEDCVVAGAVGDQAHVLVSNWTQTDIGLSVDGSELTTTSLRPDAPETADGLSITNIGEHTNIGGGYGFSFLHRGTIRFVAVYPTPRDATWIAKFNVWAEGKGLI